LHDLSELGVIVPQVLKSNPDSFESYDDHTFSLAVKYFPEFASHMKANLFSGSVDARNIRAAMKYFKQAMAEAEYKNDESFWKLLHRRWDSALNQETSRVKTDRLWLFDCDDKGMADELLTIIHMTCKEDHYTYHYKTKNGEHVICKGFPQTAIAHRPNLVAARMVNAYMLWAY
jgi:hypothetical protein